MSNSKLPNQLRIADLLFELSATKLMGSIQEEGLVWSITVDAKPMVVDGETWRPRCYSESLLAIEGLRVVHWSDPFKRMLRWDDGFELKANRPQAMFCVFEHVPVYKSTLKISAFHESPEIHIDWKGKCDIFFGDYSSNIDFQISTFGVFDGIVVGSAGANLAEDQARQALRKHVSEGDFVYQSPKSSYDCPVMKLERTHRPTNGIGRANPFAK